MPRALDGALGATRLSDLHIRPFLAAGRHAGPDGVFPGRTVHLAAARPSSLGALAAIGDAALILAAVALLVLAYYISLRIWPYGPCFRCLGHPGKNRGSSRRRWGRCKRCKGTGQRTRLGARLLHTVKGGDR